MRKISNQTLTVDLASIIPHERIYKDEFRRRALSIDASMFLRQATIGVDTADGKEVAALLAYARRPGVAVTFRAGSTSLNGQCSAMAFLHVYEVLSAKK